jgi:hypothetical protein
MKNGGCWTMGCRAIFNCKASHEVVFSGLNGNATVVDAMAITISFKILDR